LTLEHRSPRELEEPQTAIRGGGGRRAPHPTRGVSSSRTRRSQFSSSTGLSSLSPNSRESMDPIAELLSQLSGVRRAANLGQSHSSQLQQLQMQLQLERHAGASVRQPFDRTPIERVIRRHQHASQSGSNVSMGPAPASVGPPNPSASSNGPNTSQQLPYVVLMEPNPSPAPLPSAHNPNANSALKPSSNSSFLLSKCTDVPLSESEQQALEIHRANRSLFVQELLVSTLTGLNMIEDSDGESSVEERLSHFTKAGSKESAEDSLSDRDLEVHPKISNDDEHPHPESPIDVASAKHDNDNNIVGSEPTSENEEVPDEPISNRAMKAPQSCDRDGARRRMESASNGTYHELNIDQENQISSHQQSRRQPPRYEQNPTNNTPTTNKTRPSNMNMPHGPHRRNQLHNGPHPPVGSSAQNQTATRYKVLRNRSSSEASPPH